MQGIAVTLPEMLDAREARAYRQKKMLEKYECPMICFSMNIAGPVKTSALIKRAFIEGCKQIEKSLKYAGLQVKYQKTLECAAGSTAFFVVQLMKTIIDVNKTLLKLFDLI